MFELDYLVRKHYMLMFLTVFSGILIASKLSEGDFCTCA